MQIDELYSRKIASQPIGPVAIVGWFTPGYWGVGFELIRWGILFYFGPLMVGVAKL